VGVTQPFRYNTVSVLGAWCLPDGKDYINEGTWQKVQSAFLQNAYGEKVGLWISSIAKSWQVILVSIPVAIILGYIYLFIIRLIGGFIVWVSFVLIILALAAVGFYSFFYLKYQYVVDDPIRKYIEWGAYAAWSLSGIVALSLLCCCSAIKIGIAVFKTTAKYVADNMHIFFLPMIASIVACIWYLLWVASFVFIYSVGDPEPREAPLSFITNISWTHGTKCVVAYHIFALFWVNAFIMGVNQFIIGASACLWYFECNTDTKGRGTVCRAYSYAMRYHLGSVAFGSFLIAVCQMMRLLFEYYR
jgi:hypothetical protein